MKSIYPVCCMLIAAFLAMSPRYVSAQEGPKVDFVCGIQIGTRTDMINGSILLTEMSWPGYLQGTFEKTGLFNGYATFKFFTRVKNVTEDGLDHVIQHIEVNKADGNPIIRSSSSGTTNVKFEQSLDIFAVAGEVPKQNSVGCDFKFLK